MVKKKNSRDSKLSFILIGPKYGGEIYGYTLSRRRDRLNFRIQTNYSLNPEIF
ncbi:hypothetical protein JCM19314_1100 [Nonlabens ulvanivorans]|uniref:Uncharacterized protein n=1 Tax=Nonlabens ulvanivorans TaxID=906888 RepID=A0A090QAA4_NONUL|nr:hypothetical protein JCM19314_1100 [Nonlabens ulvanivorans]